MSSPGSQQQSDFFQLDLSSLLPSVSLIPNLEYEYFKLESELDRGWPWPLDAVQRFFEDLWNLVANIPGRVWGFFEEKLRDGLRWLWGNVAYQLVYYAFDAWLITDEWTRGWAEPWKSIARLFLFPSAFLFKAYRDHIEPALRNLARDIKVYFDGAFSAVGEVIKSVFSPIIDPIRGFIDVARRFFTETLPGFVKSAVDFFMSLPQRMLDLYNWVREKFEAGWTSLVGFFTKTLPEWLSTIRDFVVNLPERIRRFFTEELPSYLGPILRSAWDWVDANIVQRIRAGVDAVVDAIRRWVEGFVREVYSLMLRLPELVERYGEVEVIVMMLPVALAETATATAVDLAQTKVAGTGVELQSLWSSIKKYIDAVFDPKIFTSVFFAIAVQKPLEYVIRRMFRTERPSPADALKFLAKNLVTEEEAMSYLQIAGYPDDIARVYLRSIFREPSFEAVFTAYKRGKIDDREYSVWLKVLNVDRAETLDGTLYPYRVLEEAAYKLPSPFVLAFAVETGEISYEDLKRMLEYDLIHPEFVDIVARALLWRAARDDRALLRRYVVDLFSEGVLKTSELEHYLSVLGVTGDLTKSIVEVADLNRRKTVRRKLLSYLERSFLEGYISREDFVEQLVSYGFDEEIVREYATLLQYVRDNYVAVKETRDERNSLKSSLVSRFKQGFITEEELEAELRKLNLNEIEIALTIARAKLEFEAEQKEILFKDLVEKLRTGQMSKSEFTDQCTKLGIRYERCLAYADYYWTKYIGEEFYVLTRDERSALASALLRKYVMGFMDRDQLREELLKLKLTPEEVELRIRRAEVEDEVKYLADLLAEADSLLKKQEITAEEYVEYLVSLGMRRERAEARARRILATLRKKA